MDEWCYVCPPTQQTQLLFPTSRIRTTLHPKNIDMLLRPHTSHKHFLYKV